MRADVLVVGAGPAGSLAARAIAGAGRAVVLVDRAPFPREKVCGGCLGGRALAALDAAGLADLLPSLGAGRLDRLLVASPERRASLAMPAGLVVARRDLDAALVREAERRGVTFRSGRAARLTGVDADGVTARVGGDEVRARVAVVADGLGGGFLGADDRWRPEVDPGSRIGAGCRVEAAPADYPGGTVHMAVGRAGYAGLVRRPDGSLDVAAALDPDAVRTRGGPAAVVVEQLRAAGLPPVPGLADARWRGTPALSRRRRRIAGERILVLGDATGYVEPFTGEGIGWAMASALAVAPLAARGAARWDDLLAREWERRHRAVVVSRQGSCRAVRSLLRRPRLTGAALALLRAAPRLADPLLARINAAVPIPGVAG